MVTSSVGAIGVVETEIGRIDMVESSRSESGIVTAVVRDESQKGPEVSCAH